VSGVSLSAVPSVNATCLNCSASLVADQRYCLACGQPASPVRLAFLDVLQAEHESRAAPTILPAQHGYLPALEPRPHTGSWLHRHGPLFGLLTALLLTGLIGLLVGHWISASKSSGPQVIKLEASGLGAPPATSSAATTSAPTTTVPAATQSKKASTKSKETAEVKEAKELEAKETKTVAPKPHKVSTSSLQKLGSTSGKQHVLEVNKAIKGIAPVETGG
jgi:hypothetical protein